MPTPSFDDLYHEACDSPDYDKMAELSASRKLAAYMMRVLMPDTPLNRFFKGERIREDSTEDWLTRFAQFYEHLPLEFMLRPPPQTKKDKTPLTVARMFNNPGDLYLIKSFLYVRSGFGREAASRLAIVSPLQGLSVGGSSYLVCHANPDIGNATVSSMRVTTGDGPVWIASFAEVVQALRSYR